MQVCVTGAAGFMGSWLCDELIKQGHIVMGIDDGSGGELDNVNKNVIFYKEDCSNYDVIKKYIIDFKPELICHLAADAREGRSFFSPIDCTKRNMLAFICTLTAGIKSKSMKRFILYSSMAAYGEPGFDPPFDETMEKHPVDIYGCNKSTMEEMLKIQSNCFGFDWSIIRPHNVYGPKQYLRDPYRNVVAIFLKKAMLGEKIYIYGDGNQRRAFSYIEDNISCMISAITTNAIVGEVVNLGAKTDVSINDLAKIIFEVVGRKLNVEYIPPRHAEVKYAYCTIDKSVKLLNYKEKTTLKDGIIKMKQWLEKLPQIPPFNYVGTELESNKMPITWREQKN